MAETYYWLIRIQERYSDEIIGHIPVPFVLKTLRGYKNILFLLNRPIYEREKEFKCPVCGENTFFEGVCADCFEDLYEVEEETTEEKLKEKVRSDFKEFIISELLTKNVDEVEEETNIKLNLVISKYDMLGGVNNGSDRE